MYKHLAVLAAVLIAAGAVTAPAVTALAVVAVAVSVVAGLRHTTPRRPIPVRATDTAWARACGLHVTAPASA